MGYTEIKNKRIEELQRRVNEVGKEVKTAQAKVTAATNTLKNRTDVYTQDKANKDTAKQNLELLEKAQGSCTTVHELFLLLPKMQIPCTAIR